MPTAVRTGQHVPDILDCLAQLSNDEVPTPPRLARAMLDILPDEVWRRVDYRWLDPCCKSGIFLREIAARLLEGLSDQIPEFEKRRSHIYRNMLWGTSITEMTGMISRRTLYYSHDAAGHQSVIQFDDPAGNLPFVRSTHSFPKRKDGTVTGGCTECGAPLDLERGEGRENYAYSVLHGTYPTEGMHDMKFDVIVGNPPYQIGTGSTGSNQAKPIYHRFVEAALALNPRYVVMITPSRWFSGGWGLGPFRERMMSDQQLRRLVDFPKLYDAFPGVKIRGGVSYFLWDRDFEGPCEVQTMWDGQPLGPAVARHLDAYDVIVRRNEAVPILDKVLAFRVDGEPEGRVSERVSGMKPFGLATNFHGSAEPRVGKSVKLYGSQRVSWVSRSQVPQNSDWIDDWKVLMTRIQGTSAAVETQFLSKPIVAGKGTACTETYVVAGRFQTAQEAENFASYLRTRFVRFLVSLHKPSQDAGKDVYSFVPDVPLDRAWTDDDLYARYGLTADEIAFVESQVKGMPAESGHE
jgi:site-specific DNA-methyltransferase (adenine-specific)